MENDDYVAALVRFAADSRAAGAVGTLEASRVIVGPQCGLGFEIYGTEGSATWNFEQMNELRVCLGRGGPHFGYTTVLGNPTSATMHTFSRVLATAWATTISRSSRRRSSSSR